MNFAVRAALFGVATLLTTTWFYGWPHTQFILFRSRVYCWLCDNSVMDHCTVPLPPGADYLDPCPAQAAKVEALYTLATSVEYALSVVPGYVYDNVGVRACGGIGVGLFAAGWTLFTMSSRSLQLYFPAFFLFGHGINYVALACLSLSEYAKDWEYLSMSIAMMAQQMATIIPPILWQLILAFPTVSPMWTLVGYWLCLGVPFGLTMISSLPSRRRVRRVSGVVDESLDPEWSSFFSELTRPDYLVYVAWYATTNMGVNTVMTNMVGTMGPNVSSYYGWISWLPLGPLMGLLNEYVHSIWSLWAITFAKVFIFTAFIVNSTSYNYFCVTLQMVEIGYVHALKIYYINENFEKQHLGKLAGFASFVSGLLQLLNIYVEGDSSIPIRFEFGFWLTFTPVQILMLGYLTKSHLRRMHACERVYSAA